MDWFQFLTIPRFSGLRTWRTRAIDRNVDAGCLVANAVINDENFIVIMQLRNKALHKFLEGLPAIVSGYGNSDGHRLPICIRSNRIGSRFENQLTAKQLRKFPGHANQDLLSPTR